MIQIALLICLLNFQEEISFKPKEEFEIKLDLSFKQRASSDNKSVHVSETRKEHERRTSTAMLPFLSLKVFILKKNADEAKLKVIRDNLTSVITKKIEEGMELQLNLGFTDDIKDGISGYKHDIQFLSADKKILSHIIIEVDKDGYYFVNGEKRGKV